MPKTHVPMSPSELPQQRLYAVETLPPIDERPPIEIHGYDGRDSPKTIHRNSQLIAQAEWAWGPMNNRIYAYWLHPGRSRWHLWLAALDDNSVPWRWERILVASCPRRNVSDELAAVSLMVAFWMWDVQTENLDPYHWLNQTGLLSVGQINAIRDEVWP